MVCSKNFAWLYEGVMTLIFGSSFIFFTLVSCIRIVFTYILQRYQKTKKMKRIILLPVLLLLTVYANAQVWDWVQTIRPGGNEYCWDVANDAQGNVLATGRVKAFSSFGSGAFVQTPPPKTTDETDVFVAKYRHNGDLVWVSRDGGAGADWGKCITSDLQSNVFVTGDYYDSARFGDKLVIPVALGSSGMIRNIFVAKYDSSGVCLWAKSAGNAAAHSRGYGIVTDSAGNCYVVGHISGAGNFDGVTFGINGYNLPFIAKFSPAGTCIWAQSLSCQYGGECNDIKMDKDGNLLITGLYKGTIHCGPAAYTRTSPSWADVFVAKINQSGTFIWSAVAKGAFQDQANAVDSDSDGNVYIVGTFANDLTFGVSPATVTINSMGTGATATAANSLADVFLAKYSSSGVFQWVKTIGNAVTPGTIPDPNDAWADDIVITKSNKIIIGGFLFGNSNMSGIPLALDTINHSAFITASDQSGNVLWYKLHTGPGNNSIVRGLSADAYSNIYMGGEYSGNPYSSYDSVTVQSYNGYDGIVAKLTPPLDPLVAADTTSICPNNQVQFSLQQDGDPLGYQWSFPGGSPSTSSAANPVISYPAAGSYDVSVIVGNGHVTDTVLLSNYVH